MRKKYQPDSEVQSVFDEAQSKSDKSRLTNSKDISADRLARRLKASLDDAFVRYAEQNPKAPDDVAKQLWEKALAGNMDAIKHLNSRVDQNPPQRLELTGAEGGPILVDKPLSEMTEDELIRLASADKGRTG